VDDLRQISTNDLDSPIAKFCLALEQDRRTPEGRIRSEREFREQFFPYDESGATDRILKFLPREVRGPIIASWGIRGQKAAMRDDDGRVRAVVHDALAAGDINDQVFEEGFSPETVIGWVELSEWWGFWRGGKHAKASIQRALELAFELQLFDASWFFGVLESGGGKLHGTDVLVEGMSKTELADWIKKIHESGDGSPNGMLSALGWATVVAKTANTVLLAVIDAFAKKNDLVEGAAAGPTEARAAVSSDTDPHVMDRSRSQGEPAPEVSGDDDDDALLSSLEPKGASDDADWLENPVAVPQEGADDLDLPIDDGGLAPAVDADSDVTTMFQGGEDKHWEGSMGRHGDSDDSDGPRKAALPGLPSSVIRKSKAPPPMPESGGKGRKY
jgi:hypothetical protein